MDQLQSQVNELTNQVSSSQIEINNLKSAINELIQQSKQQAQYFASFSSSSVKSSLPSSINNNNNRPLPPSTSSSQLPSVSTQPINSSFFQPLPLNTTVTSPQIAANTSIVENNQQQLQLITPTKIYKAPIFNNSNIKPFDGNNFEQWYAKVEILLRQDGIDYMLRYDTANPPIPPPAGREQLVDLDRQRASDSLRYLIDDRMAPKLRFCNSPAQIINVLEAEYRSKSELVRASLRRTLGNMKLADKDDINNFLLQFDKLISDMYSVDPYVTESEIAYNLRNAFPHFLKHEARTLEITGKTSLAETRAFLAQHGQAQQLQRNVKFTSTNDQHALTTGTKTTHCSYCKQTGHWIKDCKTRIIADKRAGKYDEEQERLRWSQTPTNKSNSNNNQRDSRSKSPDQRGRSKSPSSDRFQRSKSPTPSQNRSDRNSNSNFETANITDAL